MNKNKPISGRLIEDYEKLVEAHSKAQNDMTQYELDIATLCHVSLSTVRGWRLGTSTPKPAKLKLLAKHFSCSEEEVLRYATPWGKEKKRRKK